VGTANSALAVAQANTLNNIIGIDLSQDMLAVAEAKIQKRAIRNISLHQMDATRMSFQNGEFDIVMISFALHELDYELMMRILSEMSRVVKPDGKLYIIDYEQGDSFLKNLILSAHLKIFEPSHMPRFLQYDWNKILGELRFQVVGIEKYLFSKLISAVRGSTL
jgi:demethylmenaquinone methyltransferase/2-methoxy-6-polyprenyl-1,4-benzoquinol methylase